MRARVNFWWSLFCRKRWRRHLRARMLRRHALEKKNAGKMLVFVPAKGGVGATTLAANFAVALTRESNSRVVIVDMDFQLGEIALGLGMTAAFSVVDALTNIERLDWDFLSTMLIRHSSGLTVLASPEEFGFFQLSGREGATRLVRRTFCATSLTM